jgi:hypothetical protein
MLLLLVFTIFIVIMKIKSFQDNSESILINIKDIVLRCDFHQRYVDLLYLHKHSHQRVLKSKPLKEIVAYDLNGLLLKTNELISEFSIPTYHMTNVFRHDRNDRFILVECSTGVRIEIDKELNGIRDRSKRKYSNMYKRKPDNYYRGTAIKEYHRIHKEIKRAFDMSKRILKLREN